MRILRTFSLLLSAVGASTLPSKLSLARSLSRSLSSSNQCSNDEYSVSIDLFTDGSASDLSWKIVDMETNTEQENAPVGTFSNNQAYSEVVCLPRKYESGNSEGTADYHIFFYKNGSNSMNDYDPATEDVPFIRVTVDGFLKYYDKKPAFESTDGYLNTNLPVIKLDVNDVKCHLNEYQVNFSFKDDVYGDETSWDIIRYEGEIASNNFVKILESTHYAGILGEDATYGAQYCLDKSEESKYYLKVSDIYRDGWDCGNDYYSRNDGECDSFLKIEVDGEIKYFQKDPGHFGPDGDIQVALNLIQTNNGCGDQLDWKYDGIKDGLSFTFDCALVSMIKDASPFSYNICEQLDGVYFQDKTVYNACCACGGGIHLSVPPSLVPTSTPSTEPSSEPSSTPSVLPTSIPSFVPTSKPSSVPTSKPSLQPSSEPTSEPSAVPTSVPSLQPSSEPTSVPSSVPTSQPSLAPSSAPSSQPSSTPSLAPSSTPSLAPSSQPSSTPSLAPSSQPSSQPSSKPSSTPSLAPSSQPSSQPSSKPSLTPSSFPSLKPSQEPSDHPSNTPSAPPSSIPSRTPSEFPSLIPSSEPSKRPTRSPTRSPTAKPSVKPSAKPSAKPTTSAIPSKQPTANPTETPTAKPTPDFSGWCKDSDGRFSITSVDWIKNRKNCNWAREKRWFRCTVQEVQENCPVTCDYCTCIDNEQQFSVTGQGMKTCSWAATNKWRCPEFPAVNANCPLTCGHCDK